MSVDLHLSHVVLTDAIKLKAPIGTGAFFSITRIDLADLVMATKVALSALKPLPPLVVLKRPLLERDLDKPSNRRVFSSMATELQILRDTELRRHPNIISLLGVCWYPDLDRITPVFVLEAATLGDLENFFSGTALTPIEEIRLCTDIARGLHAIHERGIIHCDLKPQNILIFEQGEGHYIAKLADFGSSLLLSDQIVAMSSIGGTKAWQAPEVCELSTSNGLILAEVYSLGMVFWYAFTNGSSAVILDSCDIALFRRQKSLVIYSTPPSQPWKTQ